MGNDPPHQSRISPKLSQTQILLKAGKIAQNLQLYQSQFQLKQQRHLLARILIYGHEHLIEHMRTFSKQEQRGIIKELKSIDYETIDMMYENLVMRPVQNRDRKDGRDGKNQDVYDQWKNGCICEDKYQIMGANRDEYNNVCKQGEQLLTSNKVAIILFIGQPTPTFSSTIPKQFYKKTQTQKCLLQIHIDQIMPYLHKYPLLTLFLACSQQHYHKLQQILSRYTFPISNNDSNNDNQHANQNQNRERNCVIKLVQNQLPIVSMNGKICIKKKDNFMVIQSPIGAGDLASLSVSKGVRLLQYLRKENIQYVSAMAVSNMAVQPIDQYVFGLLKKYPQAGVAFKCTYPDNQNECIKRIYFNRKKKTLACLNPLSGVTWQKQPQQQLPKSPVLLPTLTFSTDSLCNYLQKTRQTAPPRSQIFTAKTMQYTFYNPSTQQNNTQNCFIFEWDLDSLLFNPQMKAIGVVVERQSQFIPVTSMEGQNGWSDAYLQWVYNKIQVKDKNSSNTNNNGKQGEKDKNANLNANDNGYNNGTYKNTNPALRSQLSMDYALEKSQF